MAIFLPHYHSRCVKPLSSEMGIEAAFLFGAGRSYIDENRLTSGDYSCIMRIGVR
jgi:hypothetical protein